MTNSSVSPTIFKRLPQPTPGSQIARAAYNTHASTTLLFTRDNRRSLFFFPTHFTRRSITNAAYISDKLCGWKISTMFPLFSTPLGHQQTLRTDTFADTITYARSAQIFFFLFFPRRPSHYSPIHINIVSTRITIFLRITPKNDFTRQPVRVHWCIIIIIVTVCPYSEKLSCYCRYNNVSGTGRARVCMCACVEDEPKQWVHITGELPAATPRVPKITASSFIACVYRCICIHRRWAIKA